MTSRTVLRNPAELELLGQSRQLSKACFAPPDIRPIFLAGPLRTVRDVTDDADDDAIFVAGPLRTVRDVTDDAVIVQLSWTS